MSHRFFQSAIPLGGAKLRQHNQTLCVNHAVQAKVVGVHYAKSPFVGIATQSSVQPMSHNSSGVPHHKPIPKNVAKCHMRYSMSTSNPLINTNGFNGTPKQSCIHSMVARDDQLRPKSVNNGPYLQSGRRNLNKHILICYNGSGIIIWDTPQNYNAIACSVTLGYGLPHIESILYHISSNESTS